MSNDRIKYLLEQYAASTSTPEETKELFGWIKSTKDDGLVKDKVREVWASHTGDQDLPAVDWNTIYEKITTTPVIGTRRLWPRIAAAAAVVLIISTGAWFYLNKPLRQAQGDTAKQQKNDIAPGGNKAILTLSNGKQIILDSAANGTLTTQGNTKIIKLDSGQLAYSGNSDEILYNTITTPNGGQYQIVLADGSKVWLNAASSLRFPTSFSKDRNVELTGEGYFEVVHNAAKPFTVAVHGATVEDLGTHFNINAYSDENIIKATLLEGSVKVIKGTTNNILKPGQQAQVTSGIKIVDADVDEAVAWKNGLFNFKGADIQTIMRQISKWYDVDVVFEGKVPEGHYYGKTSRNLNASQMLKVLEESGIRFSIEGKKIIVKE